MRKSPKFIDMRSSNEEFSDTDSDDGLSEDMEALKRACQITGTNPTDHHLQLTSNVCAAASVSSSSSAESDGDYDFELVRSIQKRFAISMDMEEPLTLKPLCTLPPDWSDSDDCEEDYETLRAIQRRFAAYNDGGLKDSIEDVLHRPVQVGAAVTDYEKETSNTTHVERTNDPEGFFNCVESSELTAPKSEACDDVSRLQPSDLVKWDGPGADDAAGFPLKSSNFPKSALTFVDAIKKNRSCQKLIRSKMMQVEARIEELKKLMERVKILKDFQVACKKRTGRALSQKKDARVQLISVPKPRANTKFNEKKISAAYKGPPENLHASSYKEALAAFPVSVIREKWSKEERENLGKGVKQQFQGMLLQRSVDLFSCIDESSGDSNNIDSIIVSIKDLDLTPEKIRVFLPKVNWDQLAAMYIPGRSGAECEARFLNCEDPLINHNPWTATEDKNLLHIVQQKGLNNWIDVAVSLGTNRTPFQCLARYQRSLNASILKREWTKEEDNQLRAAVESFGESNWQLVASVIQGRTGTQCSNRWMKTLHPARRRVGKWTAEEDKRMKIAVTLFGPKTWKKVAECVPGRTQVQCRERWVNCLDPSLNMAGWTKEEDSKLEAAIAEHGYCWSKVAGCVPPRTDNQCWRRWKVLFPHEVPLLQAARKIQKAALISNFVDRESERPALGPNDFLSTETYFLAGSKNVDPSRRKNRRSRWKEACEHNEKDAIGEICSEEVPRLTNGSEVENMHCRSFSRKRRGERSHSMKKKAGSLSESHLSPCPETMLLYMSDGEEIKESALLDGNPKRRSRLQKKRSRLKVESMDGSSRPGAICNRKRVIKGGSKDCKDFDPTEECPLLLTDPNLPRVTVGKVAELGRDDAYQSRKVSKLHPRRRSSKLLKEVPETLSELEMLVGNATIFERKEETKEGKKKGPDATNDHLALFPDSMLLMEIMKKVRTANGVKVRKEKMKTQETRSSSERVAPAFVCESIHLTPANMPTKMANGDRGVNFSGNISSPCVVGIAPNQHPRSNTDTGVSRDFEDSATSSEMYNELQKRENAELLLQNCSLPENFSKPSVVGSKNTRESSFGWQERHKRLKTREHGLFIELSETEEDDTTLASFLLQSDAGQTHISSAKVGKLQRGKKYSKVESSSGTSDVSDLNPPKNRKAIDEISSSQMVELEAGSRNSNEAYPNWVLEIEAGDDTTLAHLYNKLKKRNTEAPNR